MKSFLFTSLPFQPLTGGGEGGGGDDDSLEDGKFKLCQIGRGVREDLMIRLPFYFSDYKDGNKLSSICLNYFRNSRSHQ